MAKKERTRKQKFLRFLFIKFPIIVLILGLIFAGALKMVERFPDPLQQGFEQYLSETSGSNATIEKMKTFAFIPDVHIEFEKLTFHDRNNAANINLNADIINIEIPFWSVFFGLNNLRDLQIDNLTAKKNILLPHAIEGASLKIVNEKGPEKYGSFIVATGQYKETDFTIEAEIEPKDNIYHIPMIMPFSVTLGTATVNGTLHKKLHAMTLENTVFTRAGQTSTAQDFELLKSGKYITNNPLSCLLVEGDSDVCNEYLEGS